MNKKILVTGASGFLGKQLCNSLISKKKDVIGIVRKNYKSDFPIQKCDILKIRDFYDVSCIVHLAAMVDVKKCERFPHQCFETNVYGTKNILDIARKFDSKVLFSSTGHIYGCPSHLPVSESDPRKPLSFYSYSKSSSEMLCELYSKKYGLDITIIRNFSVYGPTSPTYSVIYNIINKIINNKTIKISNFDIKRDFIYIDDVVSAFNLLLKKKIKGFSIFNVGSGKSISIENLAKKLIKISNKKISIIKTEQKNIEDDVPEIFAKTTKLQKLGWSPKFTLDEGLKKTYDYFLNFKNK